ncbi:dephospho-CoA kinase [Spiroplasma platyhelix]|uniref:Dephospho-CoA kinase n=1 Tax=Spiroplasma platyhelix PALS-1 TaxID=1276218 RepID=A0A846U5G8_9MOLU|nr:dephospho-CoA kinase [Spiroplasma platyhelix]MBE4704325.1 Dephospho-CoA kinase [Spiroplasma platyhelix PALS-1]NKE38697.1 dephospho-CoA kinase [Spiroplasma platyhelix PALS-1]UJB28907.1 dephospho-CoA kinase [Spiroplasma platyhelix PALS-1]
MILGIIGEAGVGKSTASNFFEHQGAYVISADLVVKYIYQQPETTKKIIAKMGEQFLNDDATLNQLSLRKYAFENYEFLKKLEEIIWPEMMKIIITEVESHKTEKLIVIDCAVLFNAKLDYLVDKVLLIESEENLKINRIKSRDGVSDNEAKTLLNLQKKHLILDRAIDFIIKNNGSTKDFLADLNNLMAKLISE